MIVHTNFSQVHSCLASHYTDVGTGGQGLGGQGLASHSLDIVAIALTCQGSSRGQAMFTQTQYRVQSAIGHIVVV